MVSSQDGSDILVLFWQEFVSERCYTALVMEVFLKHFYEVSGQKIIGLSNVVGL